MADAISFHPLVCLVRHERIQLGQIIHYYHFHWEIGRWRIPATSTGLFCQSSMILVRITNFDRKQNPVAALGRATFLAHSKLDSEKRNSYTYDDEATAAHATWATVDDEDDDDDGRHFNSTTKTKLLITEGNRERAPGTARSKGYLITLRLARRFAGKMFHVFSTCMKYYSVSDANHGPQLTRTIRRGKKREREKEKKKRIGKRSE